MKHPTTAAIVVVTTIVAAVLTTNCTMLDRDIDGEKVDVNPSTWEYTFKNSGKKVTGTVVFYELDPVTSKKYKKSFRDVRQGKRVNTGLDFFPSGSIHAEIHFDENGLITGEAKVFYANGNLAALIEYRGNQMNGLRKDFRINGIQSKETIYEAGKKIKEYDFDESGNKIIPAIERLELLEYRTGFYEYKDLNSYELLYQPMVIMRWKNISAEPVSDRIEIEGVFIDNKKGEEWGKASSYFQGSSDIPLQAGLSRQASMQSSVGFTSFYGISGADISCQIFINKQLYRTVKIDNEFLASNRIP